MAFGSWIGGPIKKAFGKLKAYFGKVKGKLKQLLSRKPHPQPPPAPKKPGEIGGKIVKWNWTDCRGS